MSDTGKQRLFWLASYPRSGNTWTRVLLHSYWHGAPESSDDIARTVPDLQAPNHARQAAARGRGGPAEGVRLIKTHALWSPKHPYAARTAGAIVLVRHPKDVLLSCLNYHQVMGTQGRTPDGKPAPFIPALYAKSFIHNGGDKVWRQQGFGYWHESVEAWTPGAGLAWLLVRYEVLKGDPAGELGRMLRFMGVEPDAGRVELAVKAASFDNMRALEVREKTQSNEKNPFFGGSGATLKKGYRFMHAGRVGGSLDAIEPGLDEAFDRAFAERIAGAEALADQSGTPA